MLRSLCDRLRPAVWGGRDRSAPTSLRTATLLAVVALLAAAGPGVAQQGEVTGRVTDAATGQPLAGAQVMVVGTNLGTLTNSTGNYVIRGVTAGSPRVRVLYIGYSEQTTTVNLVAGGTATVNFELQASAIALSPIVVTATGEQRRIEVGNSTATINASELTQTRPVASMADLLTARTPGVNVIPGTQTGAGVRIRIRGNSSISLTNNPIYVIDGVRVEGTTGSGSIGVGGTQPARINDINPEEIESIEIVRGPSAATLYGTDAANGVIVIRTKRGIAGRTQWTAYTEQSAITDRNDYPDAYWGWTAGSTRRNTLQCILTQVATGACAQDSVTMYNLHNDREATPYGTGHRQMYGVQARGGSETVRYFVHTEWENEDGVLKVPEFDQRWLDERGLSLRPEQRTPNALNRVSARANLDIDLGGNADLAVNMGYTTQLLRLPRSDDSGIPGVATNTFGGPGYKFMENPAGEVLHGWREVTPREIYQSVTEQDVDRVIGSLTSNWRPRDWLGARATIGLDYLSRVETQLCRFGECVDVGTPSERLGFKRDNRSNFYTHTVDAAGYATRAFTPDLEGRTTVGVQFTNVLFHRNGTYGRILPPGSTSVGATTEQFTSEVNTASRTLGSFLEQNLAFRDRLFLTGAVRTDRNSAFGEDFSTVFYPKLSVSWVVSDEPFFPALQAVNQLRLRSAYGASGVQPGTTDALQYYSATTGIGEAGDEQPGLVFTTLGNRSLRPERSTELEVGADATLWNNRVSAELTWYTKTSRDALISRTLPPSLGTGATVRFENLGEIRNRGWEALLQLQLVESPSFGWDVLLNGSTNDNVVISMGGLPDIVHSATLATREGYPIRGWWSRRLVGWNDANGNNIIEPSEIEVSAQDEYHGPSLPTHEAAFTTGFDFLNRQLRIAGMVDYKGGHILYNNTERIRCASRNNCSGLINPNASEYEQARTVMVRSGGGNGGFFEKGDFIRFREASLSYNAPERMVSRFLGGRSLLATLAARNLGVLWTEYTGVDPEAFGTTGDAPSEFQAFGPRTFYTLRFTLGF